MRHSWLPPAVEERGTALITALIMLTVMGMFLFGFETINKNELLFAGYSRNGTIAFNLAEGGIQEAIKRLNMYGANPGATCFVNSLTSGATCGSSTSTPNVNTVVYQATLASNPALFPILSTASFNGAQRKTRVLEQVLSKAGLGNIIYGRQVTFTADASLTSGDFYVRTFVAFTNNPPVCDAAATATNLVNPQVIAGTTIGTSHSVTSTPCGQPIPNVGNNPGFTTECNTVAESTTEVAPTTCPVSGRAQISGNTIPWNWHPMSPIAMGSSDFNLVVTASSLPSGVSVVQATQNSAGVTYAPAGTYTPAYWTSEPSTNGKVMLVVATQPFCINRSTGAVSLPSPAVTGSCAAGNVYYGNETNNQAVTNRFVDWGIVQDDLTRAVPTKFYQAPTCSTCSNGGPNGFQNGIRTVPLVQSINVTALACQQNVNPGTNVFYNNTNDGITCGSPITEYVNGNLGSVPFTGTKSSPEALIIDNAGQPAAQIVFSLPGSGTATCTNVNFDNYNWGMILATGDVSVSASFVFTGYIYTPGNVTITHSSVFRGGVFSANTQGASNQDTGGGGHDQVDVTASSNFCGPSSISLLSPVFSTFQTVSWQDVPANQP